MHWNNIRRKLENSPNSLSLLYQMEQTGGEPDVISYNPATDEYFLLIVPLKALPDAELSALITMP